jgi:sulfur carrier protein ThiS
MVTIVLRINKFEVNPGLKLKDSLAILGILPEAVLAVKNGEMITEDEQLKNGDTIHLIEVISGG